MTDQHKDEMPDEIWAYFDDGNGALWHSPRPDQDQSAIKYIRADISPPVPDDVAEAVAWIRKYYLNEPHGDHNPFPAYIKTLISAASTPSAEVTIKQNLSDEDYTKLVADVRKFLELGMFFGDDPVEQIVFLVHRALLEHGIKIKAGGG